MKTSFIIFALMISASILPLQAQQTNTYEDYFNHGLGLSASFTSGYGVSYRYFFNEMISIQPTTFFYFSKKNEREESGLNIGIEYQHGIFKTKYARFYLYAAYSYHRYHLHQFRYMWVSNDYDIMHLIGTGVGYDYNFNKHFSVGLNYGIRYGRILDESLYPNKPNLDISNYETSFSLSGAINFFFMF